jgi:16S rRNA (cytosine967-C5)-methyltransferase
VNGIAENQARILLRLLQRLRPHWRSDADLPARIQRLLAESRGFGSRDRRLYRELVFTALRHLPWIEPSLDSEPAEAVRRLAWLAAATKDTAAFRAAFAAGAPPTCDLAELLPAWFRDHCPAAFAPEELAALARRAPLWLRLQTAEPTGVFAEFAARGWPWSPSTAVPGAVRLETEVDVTKTAAFRDGFIEVQDLGSQMILVAAPIAPGGRWLDACAGAGGKALQLARLLGPAGQVEATDPRPSALAELRRRSARGGVANLQVVSRPTDGGYDGVLVDAPCSGTGTWRRAPHLKWTIQPGDPARQAARQREILRRHAPFVRPGGLLIYATCSLSRVENEEATGRFLDEEPAFAAVPLRERFGFPGPGPTLTILPARHDTDGFFVAAFRRA